VISGILCDLILLHGEILEAFPAGKVPPAGKVTLRTSAGLEPYPKEPFLKGWKPLYELPHIGPLHKG
jgi:hypothetical protein